MDPRRLSQLLSTTVIVIVVAIAWDVVSDASETPPAPEPPDAATQSFQEPPPPPPRQAQSAGRVEPAYTISDDRNRQPGYIELLARAEARRQIRESARSTYLNDILANSTDSVLHRWDNRIQTPVRVHFGPGEVANYQTRFLDAVRVAFRRWQETGVPVRFALDADSATAEVQLQWRLQFDIDRTGQTDLTWDANGHHQTGRITLATLNHLGQAMDAEEIRIVALHEIGHLLGLDHSPDSTDLMFPVARVRDLSARDIQSARLLYRLSPGSLR